MSPEIEKFWKKHEDEAVERVPPEEEKSFTSLSFVYMGLTASVTAFLVGSVLGASLSLGWGILAIVLGNGFLALYGGLLGNIGREKKLSSTIVMRGTYGLFGQAIPSAIIVFFLMGFLAVYGSLFGLLVNNLYSVVPAMVASIVFILLVLFSALYGWTHLELLSKIWIPLVSLFVIGSLYIVNKEMGLAAALNASPGGSMTFPLAVSFVIGCWVAAATVSADFGRYAKKKSHAFGGPMFGWLIFTSALEIVAFILALATGVGDLVEILVDLNILPLAFGIYLALMWTSGDNLLYSFSLAFSNIEQVFLKKEKIGRARWAIVGSTLAIIISIVMLSRGLVSSFQDMLLMIATAIPPIGGILISHYVILGGYKKDLLDVDMPKLNIATFVAWGLGILTAEYITYSWTVPAINGILVAIVSYVVLEKLRRSFSEEE